MIASWVFLTVTFISLFVATNLYWLRLKLAINEDHQGSVYAYLAAELPKPIYRILAVRRTNIFRHQLPDALNLLSNLLESGNTVSASLSILSDEVDSPMSDEFTQVNTQIRLGISFPIALENLYARMPVSELLPTINLLTLSYHSGASQAKLIRKHARIILSKFQHEQKVLSLSAQGRMQGWVMTALPVFLTLVLFAMEPTAMFYLASVSEGLVFFIVTLTLLVAGQLSIHRVIKRGLD